MPLFFIVKGNKAKALAETCERKIELQSFRCNSIETETYCYTKEENLAKVIKWYAAGASYGKAQPAAAGDCLWYVIKKESESL